MKKHNGMRPQDVVILLQLLATKSDTVSTNKQLAQSLKISEAEVSESLKRSDYAGLLLDLKSKIINKKALLDFLLIGLKYVFPTRPSTLTRGMPTAQSAAPLNKIIVSDEVYVWQYANGTARGQAIEPLYSTVPMIVQNQTELYELLALVDAIRTGSARVISIASQELEKRILL